MPEDYYKCFIRKNIITSWPFNKNAVSPRNNICLRAERMSILSYPKCKTQSEPSMFPFNCGWLLWEILKFGDSSRLDQGQSNSDSVRWLSASITLLWNGSSKTDHHLLFTPPLFIHSSVFSLWTWIPLVMDYPPYLREQRPSQRVLYVPPCVMWRGNVSPTCVRILADPNLLGINQNTCLERALCQRLACRPDGLLLSEPFVSPLESSGLCQINSICPWDGFQNANPPGGGT